MDQPKTSPGPLLWLALPCILILSALVAAPSARADASVINTQSTTPASRVPGEVLVRFTSDSSTAQRQNALDAAGSDGTEPIDGIPRAKKVALQNGQSINDALDELRGRDDVAWAQPNMLGHITTTSNDPDLGQLWGDDNTGQSVDGTTGTSGADIGAPDAWSLGTGTSGTKVAVVDTGIDTDNPDIAPNVDTSLSRNFAASISTGNVDPSDWNDENGHGTHVAGTIAAAGNNGIGVAGINWKADLIAVRACDFDGYCDTASVASALAYAGQVGARAANVSLGFGGTAADASAIRSAIAAYPNTLYAVAAGNDSVDNDGSGDNNTYPCDFNLNNIVCVAATDQKDRLADFSNWGETSVDLAAPGVNVLSTVPNIVEHLSPELPNGLAGWDTSPSSSWGITKTSGGYNAITYSGTGSSSTVTTPTLDFSDGDQCASYYYLRASLHPGQSFTEQVSTDNGATWQTPGPDGTIDSSSGLDPSEYTDLDSWLGDIADGKTQVKLRFLLTYAIIASSQKPSIQVVLPSAACNDPQPSGGSYDYYSGTSMATPQVTGAATLLFADQPNLTVAGARNALLSTTDPVSSLAGKTVTGGRLDLAAAVGYKAPDTSTKGSTDTKPSNSFSVVGVKRTNGGQAILRIKVPDAGAFHLYRTGKVTGARRSVSAAGTFRVRVRARGSALRKLRKRGHVVVAAKLGFMPRGGPLRQSARAVKLVKR